MKLTTTIVVTSALAGSLTFTVPSFADLCQDVCYGGAPCGTPCDVCDIPSPDGYCALVGVTTTCGGFTGCYGCLADYQQIGRELIGLTARGGTIRNPDAAAHPVLIFEVTFRDGSGCYPDRVECAEQTQVDISCSTYEGCCSVLGETCFGPSGC